MNISSRGNVNQFKIVKWRNYIHDYRISYIETNKYYVRLTKRYISILLFEQCLHVTTNQLSIPEYIGLVVPGLFFAIILDQSLLYKFLNRDLKTRTSPLSSVLFVQYLLLYQSSVSLLYISYTCSLSQTQAFESICCRCDCYFFFLYQEEHHAF